MGAEITVESGRFAAFLAAFWLCQFRDSIRDGVADSSANPGTATTRDLRMS